MGMITRYRTLNRDNVEAPRTRARQVRVCIVYIKDGRKEHQKKCVGGS